MPSDSVPIWRVFPAEAAACGRSSRSTIRRPFDPRTYRDRRCACWSWNESPHHDIAQDPRTAAWASDPRDQRGDLCSIGLVGRPEVLEEEAFLLPQLDDGTGEEQGQSQESAERIARQSRSRQGEEEAAVDGMAGERVRADADQGVIRLQHHRAAPEPPDEHAGPGGEAEPHRAQYDARPGRPRSGGEEGAHEEAE